MTTAHRPHSTIELSRNPSRAAQEMTYIITDMIDVYEQETTALNQSNTKEFMRLQEPKIRAAQRYQAGVSQIIERQHEMQDISPEVKEKLAELQHKFSEMGQQNLNALARMKRSTERLGHVIRTAAKEAASRQRGVSYGETGRLHRKAGNKISMGVSETA